MKSIKKMIIWISFIALTIFIITLVYINCFTIKLIPYQIINVQMECDDSFRYYDVDYTYIIKSKPNEISESGWWGINIEEGVDYEEYSLLISANYEIEELNRSVLKPCYVKSFDNTSNNPKDITLCTPVRGEKFEGKVFLYLVKEKNIFSIEEYEGSFFY